jgi:predicted MarR family transcription regulator
MYVRWVVRKHKNASVADTSFHDAYLVESYRDENGNPRQRTICYLGNIRQIAGEFPAIER